MRSAVSCGNTTSNECKPYDRIIELIIVAYSHDAMHDANASPAAATHCPLR